MSARRTVPLAVAIAFVCEHSELSEIHKTQTCSCWRWRCFVAATSSDLCLCPDLCGCSCLCLRLCLDRPHSSSVDRCCCCCRSCAPPPSVPCRSRPEYTQTHSLNNTHAETAHTDQSLQDVLVGRFVELARHMRWDLERVHWRVRRVVLPINQ